MSEQSRRNTKPEVLLRRELHRRGLRYFVHRQPLPSLRRAADLVFPRVRVAVFVDGCFWHGCPEHGTIPVTNDWYWRPKLARNQSRDADTTDRLREAGWSVVRIWEHESVMKAADRVASVVEHQRTERSGANVPPCRAGLPIRERGEHSE